jgi:hypothetical protein
MKLLPYSMGLLAAMALSAGCQDAELAEQVNALSQEVATLQFQHTLRVYFPLDQTNYPPNVTGLSFLDDPRVVYLLKKAMLDDRNAFTSVTKLRDMDLGFKENNGWVEYKSCENDNCGSHNWTIRVRPEADKMIVCYLRPGDALKVFRADVSWNYHEPKVVETCPLEWKE